MGRDDTKQGPLAEHVHIERAAGFMSAHGEVPLPHSFYGKFRQEGIPILPIRVCPDRTRYCRHPQAHAQPCQNLILIRSSEIDFLESDDIGVDLPQHAENAGRIVPPIPPNAAMNIV